MRWGGFFVQQPLPSCQSAWLTCTEFTVLSSLPAGEKDQLLFWIKKAEGLTELACSPAALALKEQPFPDPFYHPSSAWATPQKGWKTASVIFFPSSFYYFFSYFFFFQRFLFFITAFCQPKLGQCPPCPAPAPARPQDGGRRCRPPPRKRRRRPARSAPFHSSRQGCASARRAAMGVPAFFRWLSRKYPSIIVSCVEEKVGRDGPGRAGACPRGSGRGGRAVW